VMFVITGAEINASPDKPTGGESLFLRIKRQLN